ncbi:LacI family DNA-binding transcriptional regulator [Nonomuraea gerenzanensis]|uniref:Transcriptional regulator, LacI family n=1 Tax=Nonomuraea gerenzanensis TaxID=93944 RepID=A0A1M4ELZ0_9ACTN|nr:LacI family DNA-binding transcriptional regulator [Nonomuraea gerenzanensis]UBU11378.1 LacI family transcriptional regulator [Nonomuraea gerenzanensis]SBO99860.1 Transcriptional regulator, LacI family [Nonomuraea gerenzanensis]
MSRQITVADVARRAGTSTAVVSYVMNDGPRPVAAATRERVLAAARELGYRPNRIARALRSRITGVVGLVLADALNPYFGALAGHVEQALAGHGRLMLIGNAGYSGERQRHLVERFLDARVDGLVIASAEADDDVAALARTAGVPAVYLHNGPAAGPTPLVTADNERAVREAVAHLRAHGHRDVAFLAGPQDTGPVGRRREVWQEATGGRGALLRSAYSRAAADTLIRTLAARDAVPHALIAATDEQAIGVLSGACAAGLPVPRRVAVIGLDGTPDSAHTAPSLTVAGQPLEPMARQAVDLLFDSTATAPSLGAALVTRRSCGCD